MNERFKELPEEKQRAVLNAAMEVFAKYDYKKASTDLIAAKAGISKGLLFYYFHNKKELYLTVYEYAKQQASAAALDPSLLTISDFFELISRAGLKKLKILAENPFIVDFSLRSFYSEKEEISDDLKVANAQTIDGSFAAYFGNIDFGKFKEDTDPEKILRMIVWLMDGYLHEQQMKGKTLDLDEIEAELAVWIKMFKGISYKEEFL
ncbi:MAG: TetR/AcrR family transcriptional regulator [Lachnospiraceae bacterium]|nr:TetR/AcrR family transcriptional regulator [Lachnospiraceae bacterium]